MTSFAIGMHTASAVFFLRSWVSHRKIWLLAVSCQLCVLFAPPAYAVLVPYDSKSVLDPAKLSQITSGLKSETTKIKGFLTSGNLDEAYVVANRIVEQWKFHPIGYYYRGVIYFYQEKFELARKQFEISLDRNEDFVPSILQLAELDVRLNNQDGAISRLLTAKLQVPNDVRLSIALARHLSDNGREADALEELEQARTDYPWSPRPGLILGEYYLSKKDIARAAKYVKEVAIIDPNNPQLATLIAKVSIAEGDNSSAKQQLQTLVQSDSTEIQGYIELGTLYLGERNTDEARKAFKQALSASVGRNPVALMMLSRMELRARKPEEAIKYAQALLSNYPEMPVGQMLMGDAQLLRGNFSEAIQHYEAARDLDEFTEVIVRLHYTYRRIGRAQKAYEMLEDWAKTHPRDHRAQLALATSYEETRKYDAAMKQYEKVLEITPNAVAYNNLGLLYDTQRGDPKSLELAERALKISPNNAAIMDTVGWLRVKYGSAKDAISLLRRAVELQPNNPLFRKHLTQAMELAGNK